MLHGRPMFVTTCTLHIRARARWSVRHSCYDNIKMDLKMVMVMGYIYVTQCRDQWPTLMNMQ
jgi:hypothetical protein